MHLSPPALQTGRQTVEVDGASRRQSLGRVAELGRDRDPVDCNVRRAERSPSVVGVDPEQLSERVGLVQPAQACPRSVRRPAITAAMSQRAPVIESSAGSSNRACGVSRLAMVTARDSASSVRSARNRAHTTW